MNLNSINVELLKKAINNCINSINKSSSEKICASIMDSSIWINDCKSELKNGLEKFEDIYKKLLDTLNSYKDNVIPKIEKYQEYVLNNTNLSNEIEELKKKLYYEENEEYEDWDNIGTFDEPINVVVKKTRTVTKIDNTVKNLIESKENEIKNNRESMENIERIIMNFI